MPQNNDRKERDFSRYDALSTEELSEILRLDSEAPEGNGLDIDTLLYITGVLAERKKSTNTGKTAQEAWSSFQQNYMESEDACPAVTEEKKPAKTGKPWIRRMIAAILVVVLLVSVPLSVKALNWEKIWKTVANWAQETFSFVREDQPEINEPASKGNTDTTLQETLTEMGVPSNVVPTWIPEGYVFEKVEVDESPIQRNYIALYKNNDKLINISIFIYIDSDPQRMEVNNNIVEKYVKGNDEYYIISNNGRNSAMWTQDSYECYISGDVSVDEIKLMIDSIPKG